MWGKAVTPTPMDTMGTKVTVFPAHLASTKTPAPTRYDTLLAFPAAAPIHIYLDSSRFQMVWWLVFLSHGLVGSYALGVTALHWYLQNPEVSYAIEGAQVPEQGIVATAWSFFLVGSAHTVAILRMIWNSIKAKELTLHSSTPVQALARQSTPREPPRRWLLHATACATTIWDKCFGTTGYFGLSGPYFEVIFTIREAIEILLQTYQAYHLSRSVPRPWINQLAVISIVVNCLASPFVHWFYKHDAAKRRIVNLLQDSVLDFCCSVVIPLSIVVPYVAVFDTETLSFPDELLMDDVWYVNAVSEGRQVLVTSPLDFISTLFPHVGLFSCLVTVKNVVRRRSFKTHDAVSRLSATMLSQDERWTQSRTPSPAPRLSPCDETTGPLDDRMLSSHKPSLSSSNPLRVGRWRHVVIHSCFLLWGAVVVVLHLEAQLKTTNSVPGCELHVDAWFSTGFPCSVLLLNCHMQGIEGAAAETAHIFTQLERSSLRVVVISHCPALDIPPAFTEFPSITGLEIFNCSLVDWLISAAVRQETHPRMRYVYMVLTNWTTFPEGLLHEQLPQSLTHLLIAQNNMSELPDHIGDKWKAHQWMLLALEGIPHLHEVPVSFCRLQAVFLELASTAVSQFPVDCFVSMGVKQLVLSGSPVVELPTRVNPGLSTLAAEHTRITALPDWFEAWVGGAAYTKLYGSPVCDSSTLLNGTPTWEELCSADDATAAGLYPWDIMLPLRKYQL